MAEHCSPAALLLDDSRISPPAGLGPGGNPVSAYVSSDQEVHFEDDTVACHLAGFKKAFVDCICMCFFHFVFFRLVFVVGWLSIFSPS